MSSAGETSVLVVEDERPMRDFLSTTLSANGYAVQEAASAADALTQATTRVPDLILLDLGLPDRDGLELTRELRKASEVPIIVVSARGRESDKVAVLDAGADDYLTKPFGTRELLARIRVALRRASARADEGRRVLSAHGIEVDVALRSVTRHGELVRLTPLEFKLLVVLMSNVGRVVTHRQLLSEVWGSAYVRQTHYLRIYMGRLRAKLDPEPARPRLLVTEPGVGYRIRTE